MMKKWPVLLAFLLPGCGTMLPGQIYSTDGAVLPFEIEQSTGAGRVAATDPRTGEQFTGTYTAIREQQTSMNFGTIFSQQNRSTDAGLAQTSGASTRVGTAISGSNIANATAFLKGDRGTMLTCEMQIQAGFAPHGIGACQDNNGKQYRLQF